MSVEDRGMPASPDAERAILGAIFLDNSAYFQAEPVLRAADFSLDSHRRIYLRMQELFAQGSPVDFVTLTTALGQHKEIETVGGVAYVTSLTDGLPRVKNIEQYVKIVKDKSQLRMMIHAGTTMVTNAYEQADSADTIIEQAQTSLIQIVNDTYKEKSLLEMGRETYNRLEMERLSDGEFIGATSGLADLDVMTTGFRDRETVVIGARPGNGKTALACQIIGANCNMGEKVGFFSSEVPNDQILIRLACQRTGLHVFDTRDPRLLEINNKYHLLTGALAEIVQEWEGRFFIDDTPCIPIDKLCARARAWAAKGVKNFIVDYIQILDAPGKDEYQRVTYSMKALWYLARSTGTRVIVLSQLNRNNENSRPTMGDLRSSGAIENFANLILLLWRDLLMSEEGDIIGHTGEDEIIIPKQRSGPSQIAIKTMFDAPVGIWKPRAGNLLTV